MPLSTVLFDLDGTLLPMDLDVFLKQYFLSAAKKLSPHGYDPEEFISALWRGSYAMIKNDGSKTNEKAFWEILNGIYGAEKAKRAEEILEDFYRYDFDKLSSLCGSDTDAVKTVNYIRKKGYRIALATNPLFPHMATESRIRWAGFSPSDFEHCTTFENSRFAKPHPGYYLEVAAKLGVDPRDCLMVGNDTSDDLAAMDAGMDVFILTPCLINKKNIDLENVPHGEFSDLIVYINSKSR
ncbi:MAG: HAD family hydrolase [Clostridia bacterium]|nr:HAD family hydrolase [Clostridia bacterium]